MRRIFISATSRELGSYRRAVRDVLLRKDVFPVLQDHFPPDYCTVVEMLEEKIRHCDAVICLVGFVYGQEPRQRPAAAPRHSYTQLEYVIARRLGKPVYLFLAQEDCPCDTRVDEAADLHQLQLAYREHLRQSDQIRYAFRSVEDLQAQVGAITFPPSPVDDEPAAQQPNNLPYPSLGTLFKGRESFLVTLRETLLSTPSHAAALVPQTAIHGLGGVGKTRLAVEYAWRHQAEYTALLFVLADTPSNLRRNLAALVGPLLLNLAEQQAQEEDVQMAAARRWLQTHPGWLLILDNVDVVLLQPTNRLAEAEPLYQRALAIVLAAYSSQYPHTQTVAANYRSLHAATGWSETQIEEKLHEVRSDGGGTERWWGRGGAPAALLSQWNAAAPVR